LGPERQAFVGAGLNHQRGGLGNLDPGTGEVPGRLGYDRAVFVTERLKARISGVQLS
jgi:hypothetical protein